LVWFRLWRSLVRSFSETASILFGCFRLYR
jgi:hypothetical protein